MVGQRDLVELMTASYWDGVAFPLLTLCLLQLLKRLCCLDVPWQSFNYLSNLVTVRSDLVPRNNRQLLSLTHYEMTMCERRATEDDVKELD